MAFRCSDGIIVAADRQGTYGDLTLTETAKVHKISDRSVVAFSWVDVNWVACFVRFVSEEPQTAPDTERIESALSKYRAYVRHEFPRGVPQKGDVFQAVLGTAEGNAFKIFDFGTHQPLREETEHDRVLVGSAVRKAEALVKVGEFGLFVIFQDAAYKRWSYLSLLPSKICSLLLFALPLQEGTVQGLQIYEIRQEAKELDVVRDILEGNASILPPMMASLRRDIPPARLVSSTDAINALPTKLKKLFEDYAKENPNCDQPSAR